MDFVFRFFVLLLITSVTLFAASERWVKYNTWLMAAFLLVAGLVFIV